MVDFLIDLPKLFGQLKLIANKNDQKVSMTNMWILIRLICSQKDSTAMRNKVIWQRWILMI